jgi:hypothetical protein
MAVRTAPILLLCTLALAACGGSRGPSIDADVAEKLARQADAVAQTADPCAARTHARILRRQAVAAINAGRIPASFQEPLLARANELADELALRCLPVPAASTPAPSPPPVTIRVPSGPRGHGWGKHDKHDKHDKGGKHHGHGGHGR